MFRIKLGAAKVALIRAARSTQTFDAFSFQRRLHEMKRVLLIVVAIFEIVSGLAGLFLVIGAFIGKLSSELAPTLWYGLFPAASVIAGGLLLFRLKYGFGLSVLVQLLQVPFIQMAVLSLDLGVALHLTASAYWAPRHGEAGMVLGINFLALGVLVVLLLCRPRTGLPSTAASNKSLDASGGSVFRN